MAGQHKVEIEIGGKLDKSFGASIKNAQASLKALGGKALKGLATGATAALAAGGAAAAAVAGYAVKVGSGFEEAMSSAAATANATDEQYKKMAAAAKEMGMTTSKTAAESANALEYMALAGWDVETSISALPSVLKLSEASGMDLARCSDLVTDSMASLGVTVSELPGYLDVAAKAQNSSNQSAEQLMEAYLKVGGTMKNLHVPVAESAAALGVLANRGRKGGEAGQALSSILVNLTSGAGQAGKMMDALGISAFDAKGDFIGLKKTLELVDDATKGLTEQERNAALAALGGKEHIKDLDKLLAGLNDTTEDGVQEWAALEGKLEDAGGALETMRDVKMDNLKGDLAGLTSATEAVGIGIYENIKSPIREAVQFATKEFQQLAKNIEAQGWDGLVISIGPMLADAVAGISAAAPGFISAAAQIVQGLLQGIEANAGQIGQGLISAVASAALGIFAIAPSLVSAGASLITSLQGGIAQALPLLVQHGVMAAWQVLSGIMQALPGIIEGGFQITLGFAKGIAASLPAIVSMGAQLITNLINGIANNIGSVLSTAGEIIGALLQGLVAAIPNFILGGIQVVVALIQGIGTAIPQIIGAAEDIVNALASGIATAITQTDWLAVAKGIFDGIVNALKSLFGGIGDFLFGGFDDTMQTVLEAQDMAAAGKEAANAYADGFLSGVPTIEAAYQGAANSFDFSIPIQNSQMQLAGFSSTAASSFGTVSTQGALAQGSVAGISGAAQAARQSLEGIGSVNISPTVTMPDLSGLGTQVAGPTVDTSQISTAAQTAASSFTQITQNAQAAAQSTQSAMQSTGTSFVQLGTDAQAAGLSIAGIGTQGAEGLSQIDTASASTAASFTQIAQSAQEAEDALASISGADAFSGMADGADEAYTQISAAMDMIAESVTTNIQTAHNTVSTGSQAMEQILSAAASGMQASFTQAMGAILSSANSTASGIRSAFSGINLQSEGANMMRGLLNGMNSMRAQVAAAARAIAQEAKNAVDAAMDIHSPSRVMMESGAFVGEGFAEGITAQLPAVREAALGIASPLKEGAPSPIQFWASGTSGAAQEAGGSGGASITAGDMPVTVSYNFYGGAPSREELEHTAELTERAFRRQFERMQRNHRRYAMA